MYTYLPVTWDPKMCGYTLRLSDNSNFVGSQRHWLGSVRSLHTCARYPVRVNGSGSIFGFLVGFVLEEAEFMPNDNNLRGGWFVSGS